MAVSHGKIEQMSRTLSLKYHKLHYLHTTNSIIYIYHETEQSDGRLALKIRTNVTNFIIQISRTPSSTYHQLHHLHTSRNQAVGWLFHMGKLNKCHELYHLNAANSVREMFWTPSSTFDDTEQSDCRFTWRNWTHVTNSITKMTQTLFVTNSTIQILRVIMIVTNSIIYISQTLLAIYQELDHLYLTSHHECHELYHLNTANSARYISWSRPSVSHKASWISRTLPSTFHKLCSLYIANSTICI